MSHLVTRLLSMLDARLYRYPFEGRSAQRYARDERCGFGDLDERLLHRWDGELRRARTLVDVGAGPGVLATRLAAAYPHLAVITVEPSADLAAAARGVGAVRARAEALPLAAGCADLAVCLSSIRHVSDRRAALRELARVLVPAGVLYIVELDPDASRRRIARHSRNMRSWLSRITFGPLVVKTAPPARAIAALAAREGWQCAAVDADPLQPVYIMRLVRPAPRRAR